MWRKQTIRIELVSSETDSTILINSKGEGWLRIIKRVPNQDFSPTSFSGQRRVIASFT